MVARTDTDEFMYDRWLKIKATGQGVLSTVGSQDPLTMIGLL